MKKWLILIISLLAIIIGSPFIIIIAIVALFLTPFLLIVSIPFLIWYFNREGVEKPGFRQIFGILLCFSIILMPYGIAFVTGNKSSWVVLILCFTLLLWPVAFIKESNRCLRFYKLETQDPIYRELNGVLLCITGFFAPIGVALLRNKKPEMLAIIFLLNVVMFTWPVALILALPHRKTPFLAFNQP